MRQPNLKATPMTGAMTFRNQISPYLVTAAKRWKAVASALPLGDRKPM